MAADHLPFPVRATYASLYKWPESDVEFVKSMNSAAKSDRRSGFLYGGKPGAVDALWCRQLYLRSYNFSRKEDCAVTQCFGCKSKDKRTRRSGDGRGKRSAGSMFRLLMSCAIKIEVVD